MVSNRTITTTIVTIIGASAALFIGLAMQRDSFTDQPSTSPVNESSAPGESVTISVYQPKEYADDRILVGSASNVFVSKVIKQVANTRSGSSAPRSQFELVVILNIKGELGGTVSVMQLGA